MPNVERILTATQSILDAADGMKMGDFVTALCIAIDTLCMSVNVDPRKVINDIRDSIVSVNDFMDSFKEV